MDYFGSAGLGWLASSAFQTSGRNWMDWGWIEGDVALGWIEGDVALDSDWNDRLVGCSMNSYVPFNLSDYRGVGTGLDAEVAKFHGVRSVYDALVGDSEPPHLYIYLPFFAGSFLDRSTTIIHEVSHLVGSIDAGHIGEFGFKPVYVAVETPEEVIYDTCAGFSPSGPIYPDGIGIDDYTRMSHADTFAWFTKKWG